MRTHYCGELSAALVDRTVTLCGWAHRRRDHGGVIFIDLRDREGLAQVVCDPDRAAAFGAAERVRNEYVLRVTGRVRRRPEGTVNPELRSGEIEVLADEDLRADRQPEFTQIDIETSFLDERAIQDLMEGLIVQVFRDVLGVDLPQPFARLAYADALARYGVDKPDLRIPLELTELTELMRAVEFKVFRQAADLPGGRVAALKVSAELTRKEIDDFGPFVATYGAKGLAYIKVNERSKIPEGLQSPIVKFLPADVLRQVLERTGAQNGDVVFFGADKASVVNAALGALRVKIGQDKNLVQKGWCPLWVV